MADTIQFRRGDADSIPRLADGEPGWCRDTKELYIGSPSGNVKAMDAALIATVEQQGNTLAQQGETLTQQGLTLAEQGRMVDAHEQMVTEHGQTLAQHGQTLAQHGQAITELDAEMDKKLSAKAALAQAELEAEAELAAVVESFNALLAAMKTAGLMES